MRKIFTILFLVIAPLTVVAGFFLLHDRKYYFISLLVAVYTLVPFFARFEKRRPQARELVILAVMIALAVVSRAAFFMIPQFKPILAIVIISGIALGKESGFLVGAMGAFVSNFIFGQGPWTPWQMLAMGIVGFLAGLLAEKGAFRELALKKLWPPLLIFGAIAAFVIYGGIVDIWTIFGMTPNPTWQTAALVYGAAIWPNTVFTAATVLFLALLARPMMEKLDRVKAKYGLMAFK